MTLARVLIVEDDALLRSSISMALGTLGIEVVGAASGSFEAIRISQSEKPDVALLDLDLGIGANGVDIARKLREINPRIGIIFLTSYSDPRLVAEREMTLPVGSRYIQKSTITDPTQIQLLIVQSKFAPLKPVSVKDQSQISLSDSQLQTLKLVANGLTTSEIARQLEISERAVEKTLTKLQQLLGIPRTVERNPRVMLTRAYLALTGKNK